MKKIGLTLNNNMNAIVLNNVRKNKTHAVLVEKLENSNLRNIILKTKIPSSIVLKSFINDLYLSYNNQIYELKEIVLKPIIKENLIKTKKVYIPNKNHPWRYGYQ